MKTSQEKSTSTSLGQTDNSRVHMLGVWYISMIEVPRGDNLLYSGSNSEPLSNYSHVSTSSVSCCLLSSRELSDMKVYEPSIRAFHCACLVRIRQLRCKTLLNSRRRMAEFSSKRNQFFFGYFHLQPERFASHTLKKGCVLYGAVGRSHHHYGTQMHSVNGVVRSCLFIG